jgi:RES domain-containing protein
MRFWRLASPRWALDRTGHGMALFGGRWNPVGVPAIYAAESIALAALEKWAHLSGVVPADPFVLVAIDVPESGIRMLTELELPEDWQAVPWPRSSEKFGGALLQPRDPNESGVLGFTVPSVIVPESHNLVLNPAHSEMQAMTLTRIRDVAFDGRMLKGTQSRLGHQHSLK